MNRPLQLGETQVLVPESFIAIYLPPGKLKPVEPWERIAQRHELCEDLAQLLTEQAGELQFRLGVHESDVLHRIHQGLLGGEAGISDAEAAWVVRRLAELLGWSWPSWLNAG